MSTIITNNAHEPAVLIIFGITGDLSKKKLLPALYDLVKSDALPKDFEVIGVTRRKLSLNQILSEIKNAVAEQGGQTDEKVMGKLAKILHVWTMDLTAAEGYIRLYDFIGSLEDAHQVHMNRLYYLSIPPQVFGPVIRLLGESGHNASCQHGAASTRLLIEKPFGYDLVSSKELIKEISVAYGDFQVYRIDHYLAKETVQNILAFRLNNPLFAAVWSHKYISHIMISAIEKIDIQGRVAFYEQTGAVRDLIQSHMLQLLALTTMELPGSMQSKDIHAAKLRLLKSVHPIMPDKLHEELVVGQYDGYRKEVSDSASTTETYAALKLHIGQDRWKDTPIFLRTGKSLHKKSTTITLVFRAGPDKGPQNCLTFHLQPDEGITVCLQAKKPGFTNEVEEVPMQFKYSENFAGTRPDAYERVLMDAIRGDKTLFSTADEVLASWRIIESLIQNLTQKKADLQPYEPGSKGPAQATRLLHPYDTEWR